MNEILISSETINTNITQSTSETQIDYMFGQTISDVTTVGTKKDDTIRAFQICIFIEKTPIPNRNDIELKKNVIAEVVHTDEAVIILSGDYDEEGYGNSFEDASIDFLNSLNDRYNSLQRRESRLSQQDLYFLNNLRKLLD